MKKIRWWDHLTINAYWLGLNVISGSLTPLILPLLVEHFLCHLWSHLCALDVDPVASTGASFRRMSLLQKGRFTAGAE